jgi:hypothetical protein
LGAARSYDAVEKLVAEKDKSLAKSVDAGFKGIMTFIDKIMRARRRVKSRGGGSMTRDPGKRRLTSSCRRSSKAAVVGVKIELTEAVETAVVSMSCKDDQAERG